MGKLVSGKYLFYSDEIETIDARDWPKDVLVMVKGHCGPLDTRPVWMDRRDVAKLLFPDEEGVS